MNMLQNLLNRLMADAYNTYRQVHRRFPGFVLYGFLFPLLISFLFAAIHANLINKIIAAVLMFVSFYFRTHPVVVAASGIFGAATHPKHPIKGAEQSALFVYLTLGTYFFYLSLWFYLFGSIGAGRNWSSVISIIVTALMIYALTKEWALTTTWARRIITVLVYFLLGYNIAVTLPAEFYIRSFGSDLVADIRIRPIDHQLVQTQKHKEQVGDQIKGKMLEMVDKDIDSIKKEIEEAGSIANLHSLNSQLSKKTALAAELQNERSKYSLARTIDRLTSSSPEGIELIEGDHPEFTVVSSDETQVTIRLNTAEKIKVLKNWDRNYVMKWAVDPVEKKVEYSTNGNFWPINVLADPPRPIGPFLMLWGPVGTEITLKPVYYPPRTAL